MSGKVALLLALAAVCNLVTVVCLKESKGVTVPWPTFGVVVSILATQWLIAQALSEGGRVGLAITAVVVAVMVGAGIIGWVWYKERLSAWEIVGYTIAVSGVVFANVARTWTSPVTPVG